MASCKECFYYDVCQCDESTIGGDYEGCVQIVCAFFEYKSNIAKVVRCEDCLNWSVIDPVGNGGWCEKMDNGTIYNDFCSYGERRETE